MTKLKNLLIKQIKETGAVSFKHYMTQCLYHEKYGYYKTVNNLGKSGDFYTSAHLGNLTGKVLGKTILDNFGKDKKINIVELGAGEGFFAKDILNYFAKENLPAYQNVSYHFVEQNDSIYKKVRKNLREHQERLFFYNCLDELGEIKNAFVFSNEFFDAFPVHLVKQQNGQLYEIFLNTDKNSFVQELHTISDEVKKEVKELNITIPEGCLAEINSDIEPVYKKLSEKIEKFQMITIDYGYTQALLYNPDRTAGTLMGYYKHKAYEDIFQMEGEMDLTSHINFDALIHYGEKYGIKSESLKSQRQFLVDFGLFDIIKDGTEPTPQEAFQLKSLLLPGSMGDVFKVLLQRKG
jgi:SAM-dependent MidA family methyltransferase